MTLNPGVLSMELRPKTPLRRIATTMPIVGFVLLVRIWISMVRLLAARGVPISIMDCINERRLTTRNADAGFMVAIDVKRTLSGPKSKDNHPGRNQRGLRGHHLHVHRDHRRPGLLRLLSTSTTSATSRSPIQTRIVRPRRLEGQRHPRQDRSGRQMKMEMSQ